MFLLLLFLWAFVCLFALGFFWGGCLVFVVVFGGVCVCGFGFGFGFVVVILGFFC